MARRPNRQVAAWSICRRCAPRPGQRGGVPFGALAGGGAGGGVTGSAGHDARAVADAARSGGVHCEVFAAEAGTLAKVEAATALGATVHLVGASVHESLEAARERAGEGGLAF